MAFPACFTGPDRTTAEAHYRGTVFAELLESPGVEETCILRSTLGFMAYHGGELEKVTDTVASEAAETAGASYYGVTQAFDPLNHISSAEIDPAQSTELTRFLAHVDVVITVHGYGRDDMRRSVLLGGQNRQLAAHLAQRLGAALPEYTMVDSLDDIPRELRGQHPRNPVNLPAARGVQIELPPIIRWHMEAWHWSDRGEGGRAPDTQRLIDALGAAATQWDPATPWEPETGGEG